MGNLSSAPKALSYGEKIAKIGPADPEITVLRAIIKKEIKKRKKKLMQAKCIAIPASLPSGLNNSVCILKTSPDLTNVDEIWCINEHGSIIINVPYCNKKLQLHLYKTMKYHISILWINSP